MLPTSFSKRASGKLREKWFAGVCVDVLWTLGRVFSGGHKKALTNQGYVQCRALRTEEGRTAKTCNNELGYLNAVFNELYRLGEVRFQNPLSSVRPLKVPEQEMGYLEHHEIRTLFQELKEGSQNPHVYLVARISLETGARWAEAEGLTLNRIKRYRVTFVDTKSGRKRTVPISQELHDALTQHLKEWGSFGASTISAFRRAVTRAGLTLPKGQCAHILRQSLRHERRKHPDAP